MILGAQLYTVRDFCKTEPEIADTLARVAEIGYKTVQVSGTGPYTPGFLADALKRNGLSCVLTHIPGDRLQKDPAGVAADHDVFGCDHVGLGYYDFPEGKDAENAKAFIGQYRPVAAELARLGKRFCYHNHWNEFRRLDGKMLMDVLADGFPDGQFAVTLDVFWAAHAGEDPAAMIAHYAGKAPCLHLKDCDTAGEMAAVGTGTLDFPAILSAAERAGSRYLLVEQDDCHGKDPFACLRESYGYLTSLGLS